MAGILPDLKMIRIGWRGLCPRCTAGSIFRPGFTLDLQDRCQACGLDLSRNDSADGPAVFLIFLLGFTLVPLALWADAVFSIPLWAHALIWGALALVLTLGLLRPLKAYIIALQYKHRPGDWDA